MSLKRILKIATKAAGRAMRRRAEGTPTVPFLAALVYGFAAGAVLTLVVTAGSEGTAGTIANGSAYRIVRDLVVLIGTIIALTIAANRARAHLAQAKAQTAQAEAQTAAIDRQTEQIRLSRREQVSSRFTEAVRQLGDPSLTIRMGGIAALWSIAEETDNHGDRRMVLDMLCAFVRRPTPDDALDSKTGAQARAEDNAGEKDQSPNSTRPDVMMAMTKIASVGPEFSRGDGDSGENYEKDLTGAWLPRTSLDYAHLEEANLTGANLSYAEPLFTNFSDANLSNADISNAYLRHAKLIRAKLADADISDANLSHAYLSHAEISGANLSNANLYEANLCDANLSHADLSGADLRRAELTNANLSGADLSGAVLNYAELTRAQYDSAITDEDTIPPAVFLDDA